jgi:predicted membrane protein
MSSIVELLYNRYIRKYSNIIFIIIIAALFIYIGHYGYKKFYLEKQAAKSAIKEAKAAKANKTRKTKA